MKAAATLYCHSAFGAGGFRFDIYYLVASHEARSILPSSQKKRGLRKASGALRGSLGRDRAGLELCRPDSALVLLSGGFRPGSQHLSGSQAVTEGRPARLPSPISARA